MEEVELCEREKENMMWVKDGSVDCKGIPASFAKTGGWKASLFIILLELTERMAYFVIISSLITYLTNELHQGVTSAAKSVNNWAGVSTVLPLVGGFLADSYIGTYWMVVASSCVYFLGLSLLTVTVSVSSLKPPPCPSKSSLYCGNASSVEVGLLFFSLYIVSIGAGGLKPSLGSYGPDQFDRNNPKEKLQKHSFFNWVFFAFSIGILLATTVLVYVEENVSWGAGIGSATAAFGLAVVVFLCGTPFYRYKVIPSAHNGSPITRIVQVFVAAGRNRNLELPDAALLHQGDSKMDGAQLEHTQSFRWLDKAAVQRLAGNSNTNPEETGIEPKPSPWNLCTVTQVEEAKQILRILPIWFTCLTITLTLTLQTTFFIKQSSTMDRKMGSNFKLPQASVFSFSMITTMLFLPLYDRVIVPVARRITGNDRGITILQRIGVGLIFSILGMVVSALVEIKRLQTAKRNGLVEKPHETIPMTVFWLAPQYIMFGITDGFILAGLQEFFYSEVPDTMANLGIAIFLSVLGVGSFLCSILITVVEKISSQANSHDHGWFLNNLNKCHLDYFFWLLACLSTINFCTYVCFSQKYTYKKTIISQKQ
ncbi:hypothetical protein SUGI_0794470 [Cryptomeria japonica]|uniref:protein NRT1/ PTR FAMILY 5.10 n=1 Tax=Cryptomeria japonica TaxID=3369 RepID=UPI0024146BB7|nr:protein NRT1/ PTR FAMILY 5.10 [Cryptomeria japonica]GLJ38974.1 hypothetical protein SUGI_0794470 [Cryptomeria japonica]